MYCFPMTIRWHLLIPQVAVLMKKRKEPVSVQPGRSGFFVQTPYQLVSGSTIITRPENFPGIAIISPYKQQIDSIERTVFHAPALLKYGNKISVNTIDSFQGQERDIVYISMTRSNPESSIGFSQISAA